MAKKPTYKRGSQAHGKTQAARLKQLANLKKGHPLIHEAPAPHPTAESAGELVKCLAAGVPPLEAVSVVDGQVLKGLSNRAKHAYVESWLGHPLVVEASEAWSHGPWQNLQSETRLQLARDVHLAQLAYFLYSHNYADLQGVDLDKADRARDALTKHLAHTQGDETPFQNIMRKILAGELKADEAFPGPPRLPPAPAPPIEAEVLPPLPQRERPH